MTSKNVENVTLYKIELYDFSISPIKMCRLNRSYGYPDHKTTKDIEINTNDGKKYKFKVSASVNFNCQDEAEVVNFKLRVNHSKGGWIKILNFTEKRMQMHLNKSIFAKCGWSDECEVTDDHVDFKDVHKTRFSVAVKNDLGYYPYAVGCMPIPRTLKPTRL